MRVVILHDYDCPLGDNGLAAFAEAADALANTPPEARHSLEDKLALAAAWADLESRRKCTCGADVEIRRRTAADVAVKGA